MVSLIPALSEKAKLEIVRSCLHPRDWGYSDEVEIYFDKAINCISQAFQDLFDLEKYPITFEQILNEFKNRSEWNLIKVDKEKYKYGFDPKPDFRKRLLENTTQSIHEAFMYLATYSNINQIILIGDIHGWWEKPQTY